MMERDFIASRQAGWEALSERVRLADRKSLPAEDYRDLPRRFRQLCADLSLAKQRMYSRALIHDLNERVIEANRLLHQDPKPWGANFVAWMTRRFPAAFRREWRLFVFCSLAFWLPFGLMLWAAFADFVWVERLLGPAQMVQLDAMYGRDVSWDESVTQSFGSRFEMFGFYIFNNVGIDFRTFAGGALAGVGALLVLCLNGLQIGASAGYCTVVGDPQKFWYFVCGHSAPELTGMIICGMAGMRVGLAWLKPGAMSRVDALSASRETALPLLLGGAVLTALAAPIEAFWSSQPIDHGVKLVFGLTWWILLHGYLVFSGRRQDAAG